MGLRPVRRLAHDDDVGAFDSSEPELDEWLRTCALSDQAASASVTYVLIRGEKVVGFYTVAPHSIETEGQNVGRLGKGLLDDRSIAVVLLTRLALDKSEQGTGLGGSLLRDALLRCVAGADELGGRSVVVRAKRDKAVGFYEHHGFTRLPENELSLYMLMKDIKRSAIEAARNNV